MNNLHSEFVRENKNVTPLFSTEGCMFYLYVFMYCMFVLIQNNTFCDMIR